MQLAYKKWFLYVVIAYRHIGIEEESFINTHTGILAYLHCKSFSAADHHVGNVLPLLKAVPGCVPH
jgi:hypothetical protein